MEWKDENLMKIKCQIVNWIVIFNFKISVKEWMNKWMNIINDDDDDEICNTKAHKDTKKNLLILSTNSFFSKLWQEIKQFITKPVHI